MYESLADVPKWKKDQYRADAYSFNVPPVCTAAWDDLAWINHIDRDGVWVVIAS